ncbi:hypothetical protein ACB094_05G214200 [Castanea mollissima]
MERTYITNSFYNSSKHFLVPLIHEGCFDITTVLGFESLLRLNKLESLDLDGNIFNQSIIQSLRLLTSLKSLNLSNNALKGSLPTKELSVFKDLEILDLRNNRLNGSETVQGREIEKP